MSRKSSPMAHSIACPLVLHHGLPGGRAAAWAGRGSCAERSGLSRRMGTRAGRPTGGGEGSSIPGWYLRKGVHRRFAGRIVVIGVLHTEHARLTGGSYVG